MNPIKLRRAAAGDGPAVLRLIVALAEFEKLTPPDPAAQQRLLEHGFGERPRFETWLAFWQDEPEPVAYALLFETYSSFLALPTLYLEDVFVLPTHRKRGIGSALLNHCIQLAHDRDCGRMEWACLDWNTGAQCVYENAFGARRLSEWYYYRLSQPDMARHLARIGRNRISAAAET